MDTIESKPQLQDLTQIFPNCAERAPMYDRENRFFQEDFDELKEAGYLLMAVPEQFGGYGMDLAEVAQKTRELAYHAAPTALALNMHNYWCGLVADLWRQGDTSLSGNDHPSMYSTTKAEKVDGGYVFTGRKSFGSLGPAWTFLGLHGQDNSDPENPKVVHAFMPRDSENWEVKKTWDNVLGMRATRSDDTILNGVFVPDKYIGRVVPTGFAGIDGFVLGIFAWALINFGNIYYAQAQRIFEIVTERLHKKKSLALASPSMAHHPGIQHDVAEMVLALEGIGPHLDAIARDWSEGKDYGPAWGVKIVAAKCHAVESAWSVVDKAMDISGGFGIFPASDLERRFRDARLGRFHPANGYLSREIMGKGMLGLDLDVRPS
jgi:alkylation response protein AidB-like acyl-CoA dehydrogenase